MTDEAIALLEQIREGQFLLLAELRGLRADLRRAALPKIRPLERQKSAKACAALLLETKNAIAGKPGFTSNELSVAIMHNTALRAAGVKVCGGTSPMEIGNALAGLIGKTYGGLRLVRCKPVGAGILWNVEESRGDGDGDAHTTPPIN